MVCTARTEHGFAKCEALPTRCRKPEEFRRRTGRIWRMETWVPGRFRGPGFTSHSKGDLRIYVNKRKWDRPGISDAAVVGASGYSDLSGVCTGTTQFRRHHQERCCFALRGA